MLNIVGDDELDIIKLPNGMTIKIDFATEETGTWVGEVESGVGIEELDYMIVKII